MSNAIDRDRRLFNFPFHLDVQTRWLDNDQYGHLNNSAYYLVADSVNNTYLYDHCGVEPFPSGSETKAVPSSAASQVIGLVISSSAQYYAPTSFPNALRVGLRVIQLGSSSVTYEFGVFEIPSSSGKRSSSASSSASNAVSLPSGALAAVLVRVTHVFVDRHTRKPVKPMPQELHAGLSRLKVDKFVIEKHAKL